MPVFNQVVDATGWHPLVQAAALTSLSASTAYTRTVDVMTASSNVALPAVFDGVTPAVGDRLLLSLEPTLADCGIYAVTSLGSAGVSPWVLTRPYDANSSSTLNWGHMVRVAQGALSGAQFSLIQRAVGAFTNNTSDQPWRLGGGPIEATDHIGKPEAPSSSDATRVAQTTWDGTVFIANEPVRFNRMAVRCTTTATGTTTFYVLQRLGGRSGTARVVATCTVTAPTAGTSANSVGTNVMTPAEGACILDPGLYYVIWGSTSGAAPTWQVQAVSATSMFNSTGTVPTGFRPTTFTAGSTATPITAMNPVVATVTAVATSNMISHRLYFV